MLTGGYMFPQEQHKKWDYLGKHRNMLENARFGFVFYWIDYSAEVWHTLDFLDKKHVKIDQGLDVLDFS